MVYGHNVATCIKCGRPYITGDCIEIDGECGECEKIEVFNIPEIELRKEKLKQEILTILNDALAGYIDKYKYKADDGKVYVRWGRVQRHIFEAVDLYWPKGKKDE